MIATAARPLLRRPGPSLLIIATLAVAIGAATVTYSIVDMLRHALPIRDASRMAFVASTDPRPSQSQAGVYGGVARTGVSIPDLADFEARAHTFEQFAAFSMGTATWTGTAAPERLRVIHITTNLLSAFALTPYAGHGFESADGRPGAAPAMMLTVRFWRERFDESPAVFGRTLIVDGEPRTVVGVLPAALDTGVFSGTDIATPIVMDPLRSARDDRRLFVFGTMKPGITRESAQGDLERLAQQLQTEYPRTNGQTGVVVRPPVEQLGPTMPVLTLFLVLITAALVALACANVANVVLAVAASRRHEFAIRRLLGASSRRHVLRLITEALLLSAAACPLGLLLAWSALNALRAAVPGPSTLAAIGLNGRVVAASMVMSVAAAIGFSLLPALRSARASTPDLRSQTRSTTAAPDRRFVAHALVTVQVAIAMVLLVQIASFTRSAWRFVDATRGFDERGLLTLKVDLPPARYIGADQIAQFATTLLSRIESLPGVTAAAAINRMPIADRELGARMIIEGTHPQPEDAPTVTLATITGDYLPAMRIPVVRGRGLTTSDVSMRHAVAVLSAAAARRYWPGRDPIGMRITIDALGSEPLEVVGIAGDVRNSDVDQGAPLQIYVPFTRRPARTMAVLVRTTSRNPSEWRRPFGAKPRAWTTRCRCSTWSR